MSRTEARAYEREEQKLKKKFAKLNPSLQEMVMQLSNQMATETIKEYESVLDRNISAAVIQKGGNIKIANEISYLTGKLMGEDIDKVYVLKKQFKTMEEQKMGVKKIEEEVKKEAKLLIEKGFGKKEIIEKLAFKYPKLSKSMVTNAYQMVKEELKGEEDPEMKEIADYIFGEDKKVIDKKEDFQEKTEKAFRNEEVEVTGATVEQANLNPSVENKGLKIKSMVVEGENGVYRVCSEGVELKNEGLLMFFENPEQLDNFYKEYKQTFEMLKA